MVLVVDIGRHGRIVLDPLVERDRTVLVAVAEVLEELEEDFVLSQFALLDLGMHRGVVSALEVVHVDHSGAVFVCDEEGGLAPRAEPGTRFSLPAARVR